MPWSIWYTHTHLGVRILWTKHHLCSHLYILYHAKKQLIHTNTTYPHIDATIPNLEMRQHSKKKSVPKSTTRCVCRTSELNPRAPLWSFRPHQEHMAESTPAWRQVISIDLGKFQPWKRREFPSTWGAPKTNQLQLPKNKGYLVQLWLPSIFFDWIWWFFSGMHPDYLIFSGFPSEKKTTCGKPKTKHERYNPGNSQQL